LVQRLNSNEKGVLKMKIFKYVFVAGALGLTAASCADMDLEPKGLLYDNVLMGSDNGIQKYLALIYQDLPVEDFNYGQNGDQKGYASNNNSGWHPGNQWQALKSSPASACLEATGRCTEYGDGWGYWPYDRIRDINTLIEKLPQYYEEGSTELNEHLAEARALRAFYYFGIVKRYGGVPIVRSVLDPLAPADELKQPRDTEYDCWKFIQEDLQFAMENGASDRSKVERMNRYGAAALMSRAMLYAGTIAKYGGYISTTGPAVQAGLMGIPAEKAAEFFQASYDACKFLKEAGFKLHTGGDKVQNFLDVFGKINNTDEDIFVKEYGLKAELPFGTQLFHMWDTAILPLGEGLSSDLGTVLHPTWEMISMYQIPKTVDENDQPIRFNDVTDFWNNDEMEARCKATFFFSGMKEPNSGTTIDVQAGVYKTFAGLTASMVTGTESGIDNEYNAGIRIRTDQASKRGESQEINGKMVKISGVHGMTVTGGDEGRSYMGAFIRKYVDYQGINTTREFFTCHQPWKIFRYGEVLCNWAEAAYELGLELGDGALKQEAIAIVNELRDRAGARPYTMVGNPVDLGTEIYGFPIDENLQFIRDERARELCYENHRLFDLRRWRVADIMFQDGVKVHTISPYYVVDEDKWIFLNEEPTENRKQNFYKRWYYEQIPGHEISKNDLLIRNDGY